MAAGLRDREGRVDAVVEAWSWYKELPDMVQILFGVMLASMIYQLWRAWEGE